MSGNAQHANAHLRRGLAPYGRGLPHQTAAAQRNEFRQLVDAARGGDREAFGALFDRCYPAIYRYAYARLGRVADAEDAAAEAFASALTALPRFRWRGAPFESWLYRIAASKVTDAIRRAARTRELSARADADESLDADPAQMLVLAERRARLLDAIEQLPRDQREVVLLRFFADRSLAEVAGSMNRSVGAVKQLQFRALVRLARMVER